MVVADFWGGFEVGDGAGEAENFVMGASGEAHFVDGRAEDVDALFVQWTELTDLLAGHLSVVHHGCALETFELSLACVHDFFANLLAGSSQFGGR